MPSPIILASRVTCIYVQEYKSLVFLFCHQFHNDLSLQQLDAGVAQVFTHEILQVKPCRGKRVHHPTPHQENRDNIPVTYRAASLPHHRQRLWPRKPRKDGKAPLTFLIPGKSAMKTTSVWLSRLLLISCNLVLQGDKSIKSGCTHGVRWKGDQTACTMSTRGSKSLRKRNHVLRRPQPPTHQISVLLLSPLNPRRGNRVSQKEKCCCPCVIASPGQRDGERM